METYKCLDLVLKEYKDYFSAKDLAQVIGIPESTLSRFRKGETNPGIKIFDRIRKGLSEICPSAYVRFMSLLATSEMDLVKMAAMAPLPVQGEILTAIASSGIFRNSRQEENKTNQNLIENSQKILSVA